MTRLIVLALVLGGGVASADELARRAALPASERGALAAQIAAARRSRPESFAAVARVLDDAEAREAEKRGAMAALGPELRALGPDAVWALAAALVDGPSLGEPARLAAAVGVIEAAGAAREPRLAALWTAVLDGPEGRFPVLRAAAEALARLDDDAAARALVLRARGEGVAASAVRAAMGHCRRAAVAEALAAALDARPSPEEARRLIRSLADVGSAWAWATTALRGRPDEARVRAVAARSLLAAFVAGDGALRQAASNALVVVDAPQTAAWIAGARAAADGETRAALDALAARLAASPLRR